MTPTRVGSLFSSLDPVAAPERDTKEEQSNLDLLFLPNRDPKQREEEEGERTRRVSSRHPLVLSPVTHSHTHREGLHSLIQDAVSKPDSLSLSLVQGSFVRSFSFLSELPLCPNSADRTYSLSLYLGLNINGNGRGTLDHQIRGPPLPQKAATPALGIFGPRARES